MEKKNKKMLLVVGVLLLFGSISFAYFVGSTLLDGTGSKTEGITASIKGATVNVDGGLTFNDLDILPGHQTISSIKVTATGNNELIPYNLIWNGTNSLNTPLKFKVYKTSKEVEVSISCEKKTKVENGYQILNEECSIFNLDKLGSVVSSGTIETAQNTTKVILAKEEFITATNDGMSVYYYVILEYPNLDEEQNEDMGGTFNGTVTVEESNAKPDINILAVKIEQDDGTYQDSDDIPQEGYVVNTEKSICSNGATPTGFAPNVTVNNLTKNGTSCYLYLNKYNPYAASDIILSNNEVKESPKTFTDVATESDTGMFVSRVENDGGDNDGDTYYFRGAVTNNYVKFANKFWRIIRINGDGTIRLIYDGTNSHSNGTSTSDSIAVVAQKFSHKDAYWNSSSDNAYVKNNAYVGFRYTSGQVDGVDNKSNALIQLELWYNNNLVSYASKLDGNAGFCSDRTPSTSFSSINYTGGTGTTVTYYGANIRLNSSYHSTTTPTFKCKNKNDDLFTTNGINNGNGSLEYPIGLITADEVVYAGGYYGKTNSSYYLYNGQNYWTISPFQYNGTADMFYVTSSYIGATSVYIANGIRPVINLRADVVLTGTGTVSDPYVVVGGN